MEKTEHRKSSMVAGQGGVHDRVQEEFKPERIKWLLKRDSGNFLKAALGSKDNWKSEGNFWNASQDEKYLSIF